MPWPHEMGCRVSNKAVQQGRSERRGGGGTDRTSWSRLPFSIVFGKRKSPSRVSDLRSLLSVEPLSDARTMLAGFFNTLLRAGRGRQIHFDPRVVLVDVLVEVGFDDAVVVDAESFTEGVLRDLESAIDVSS
jgi:hypothetical protein